MPKLCVLDGNTLNPGDNPWSGLEALGELTVYDRTPKGLVVERARGADLVFTNKTLLDREALEALSGLRGICVLATGVNVVDVAAAARLGIPVCNVPAYSARFVAQHTIALLLELCNAVGLHDGAVRAGEWSASPDFSFWKCPLLELDGLRLGIVGFGAIGGQVGVIGAALGMRVTAAASSGPGGDGSVERIPLPRLLAESDVVSLHCPLTPDNTGLINERRLATMRSSALLINTARGGLVVDGDLRRALDEGVIAGAALDVLSSEPPPADHPLLGAKNCVITPHLGWSALAARRRLMDITVQNAAALLADNPLNVVNPG